MLSHRWLFEAICASLVATAVADNAFSFSGSTWIWTSEQVSYESLSQRSAPLGSRPFRKTFVTPSGKHAVTANILVTADNTFDLYVNGQPVGAGTDQWQDGRRFDLVPLEGPENLFAVNATNEYNPQDIEGVSNAAGLLIAIQVNYADGTSSLVTSDASWRTMPSVTPLGFEKTSLDDSSWVTASVYGTYGTFPWFTSVSIPTPSSNTAGRSSIVTSTFKSTLLPSLSFSSTPIVTSTTDTNSAFLSQPSDTPAPNKATTTGIPLVFVWVYVTLVSVCNYS